MNNPRNSICVITCYKDPEYVRAVSLTNALRAALGEENVYVVKNHLRGLLRYPEVILKLIVIRVTRNPDMYLITFRGYEVLPFVRFITIGKKLIYDEFINPVEWLYEHKILKPESLLSTLISRAYGLLLRSVNKIVTDTEPHAEYSSNITKVSRSKYAVIPVGTDEKVFNELQLEPSKYYDIFYYGSSMLPLHGLDVVCEAAVIASKQSEKIRFILVGGGKHTGQIIQTAIDEGANIVYKKWVPFTELPKYIQTSSLCLGGPFGNTLQSKMVVTGKTYQFLACGAPTVIGIVDGINLFVHKENCLLVGQGDATALADVILWSLSHPDQVKKIAAEGRKLYENNFSNDVIAAKLRKVIN